MHYKSMQSQAREKHQQLREEARIHRLARQDRGRQSMLQRLSMAARPAGAAVKTLASKTKSTVAGLDSRARSIGRAIWDRSSAVHW